MSSIFSGGNGKAASNGTESQPYPWRQLGHFVSYYPNISRALGHNVKAAIFIGQLLYHTRFKKPGEPICRTVEQIGRETDLSHAEQKHARAALVKARVLKERWNGLKHRMEFVVAEDRLWELIREALSWDNGENSHCRDGENSHYYACACNKVFKDLKKSSSEAPKPADDDSRFASETEKTEESFFPVTKKELGKKSKAARSRTFEASEAEEFEAAVARNRISPKVARRCRLYRENNVRDWDKYLCAAQAAEECKHPPSAAARAAIRERERQERLAHDRERRARAVEEMERINANDGPKR